MSIISAPTVIASLDNSFDTSIFFNINEEEEKEGVKLLLEDVSLDLENYFLDNLKTDSDGYTYKKYSKPHLNLISPPPERI
ncbi:hypothetical protein [uncultured Winogradskyella sp.]|uniref:hypothetical protein n=1 Tax=uncultured Winogradskyella sp. TaxID=395353 RepID=UPI0026278506|nr:hypothetical protein [uncultured Winogradskyella sp.]